MKNQTLKIIVITSAVTVFVVLMLVFVHQDYRQTQQEEQHRQGLKNEFKKSPPLNYYNYQRSP